MRSIMFFLILGLFPFFSFQSYGQEANLVVPSEIRGIKDSIYKYRNTGDSSQIFKFTRQLYVIGNKPLNAQILSWYHLEMSKNHFDFSSKDSAHIYLDTALEQAISLPFIDHKLLATVYNNYSILISDSDAALSRKYGWLSYGHSMKLDDPVEKAVAAYQMANSHSELGNYRQAEVFAREALEFDKIANDSLGIAYDLSFLAELHFKMKDYKEAKIKYTQCFSYLDTTVSSHKNYFILLKLVLTDVLIANQEYDQSTTLLDSIEPLIGSQNKQTQYRFQIHKAHTNYFLGHEENSKLILKRIIDLSNKDGLFREAIRATYILGRIEHNLDESVSYLLDAKEMAEEVGIPAYSGLIFPTLYEKSKSLNNSALQDQINKQYVEFLTKHQADNLSAAQASLHDAVDLFQTEQENLRLELKSANQNTAIARQRNKIGLLSGAIGLLLMISLAIYLHLIARRNSAELKHSNEIALLKDRLAELLYENKQEITLPPFEEFNHIIDSPLTTKEYEILNDLIDRKTNKEIANLHFISINTVKYHLKNIYSKLDVPNKKHVLGKIKEII